MGASVDVGAPTATAQRSFGASVQASESGTPLVPSAKGAPGVRVDALKNPSFFKDAGSERFDAC